MFEPVTFLSRLAKRSTHTGHGGRLRSRLAALQQRGGAYRVIVVNAGSLVATTAATSGLGFIYWWLAARLFSPAAVGSAAAAISAMTLLGTVAMLGLGTLLMGELPRQRGRELPLLTTALLVSGVVGAALGVLFGLLAPFISPELQTLVDTPGKDLLFAVGVSLTAITLVLDQALTGLLRGGLQLGRNTIFAVAKLVALLAAGFLVADRLGLTIYTTWVLGNMVSLVVLLRLGKAHGGWNRTARPDLALLNGLKRTAIGHHGLNLALLAPGLVLPLLVTAQLSASLNASFYVAWMLANFVFVPPAALSTMLYAVGSGDPDALAHKIRFTLRLAALGGLVAVAALFVFAPFVLGIFGASYAAEAQWSLRILGFGVFPLIIKDHYIAIYRISGRVGRAALLIGLLDVFELTAAAAGAYFGGLAGLSAGWVLAMLLGTVIMVRTVYRAAQYTNHDAPPRPGNPPHTGADAAATPASSTEQQEGEMSFRQLRFLWVADLYRYTGRADLRAMLRMLLVYWEAPSYKYIFVMRLCSYLDQARPGFVFRPWYVLFRLLLKHYEYKFHIRIAPGTSIGCGLYVGHFGDIGVNSAAVIGENCNISQGVSIGQASRGERKGAPVIGDNVFIGPGAKLIGRVHIGNNVAIGANCVVTKDVPDNAVVVGIPGKVISYLGSADYVINTEYPRQLEVSSVSAQQRSR